MWCGKRATIIVVALKKMMDFCQGKKRTCGEGVDEEALSLGEEISGVAGWGQAHRGVLGAALGETGLLDVPEGDGRGARLPL